MGKRTGHCWMILSTAIETPWQCALINVTNVGSLCTPSIRVGHAFTYLSFFAAQIGPAYSMPIRVVRVTRKGFGSCGSSNHNPEAGTASSPAIDELMLRAAATRPDRSRPQHHV